MTKREKIKAMAEIVERLKLRYPEPACALEYGGDGWRLLVMGRLSAQCTDKRVNIVCRELFEKYPTAEALAAAELSDVEAIIRPCGLYRTKAENIVAASKRLVEDYGGVLPDTIEELLRFEGVGRKIANLIVGDIYGAAAVVCDTHCIRICGRLGMYPESLRDAVKIEKILREIIEPAEGADFCHRIVEFGREVCTARSPDCQHCELSDICRHAAYANKKA